MDFKVSLANNYMDLQERCSLEFPYIVQPKLDGVRCYIVREDGEVKMYTRNGNEIVSCRHVAFSLARLFDDIPGIILDGELYNHTLNHDFSSIVSIVRRKNVDEETERKARSLIHFCCFDCYIPGHPEYTYVCRNTKLANSLGPIFPDYIYMVSSDGIVSCSDEYTIRTVRREEDVDRELSIKISDGFEGVVLKEDGVYRNGRTNGLLKYKRFVDAEYTLVDILEGTGSWEGQAASVVCKDSEGRTFKAGVTDGLFMGGDSASLLENKEDYIGKQVTVKYQELTKSGVPRFGKAVSIRDYE